MYLEHFRLHCHPFRITPDTGFFFSGGSRGAVLEALLYALTTGEGIVKVVGEVGSGKTMLCRCLEQKLPTGVESVYLANPGLAATEVLQAIVMELKLQVPDHTRQFTLLQEINSYLLSRYAAGHRVVLFVEEAQNMSLETLEEIRMLANLETGTDKLLQIVLFGQPELDDLLADHDIRQLRERITHSFTLTPLVLSEVDEYLQLRLGIAGSPNAKLFEEKAVKIIAEASDGLLRRINILADKALLAAFIEHSPVVRVEHAKAALQDSDFAKGALAGTGKGLRRKELVKRGKRLKSLQAALLAMLLLGVGFAAGVLLPRYTAVDLSGSQSPAIEEVGPLMDEPSVAAEPALAEVFDTRHSEYGTDKVQPMAEESEALEVVATLETNDTAEAAEAAGILEADEAGEEAAEAAPALLEIEPLDDLFEPIGTSIASLNIPEIIESRRELTVDWVTTVSLESYVIQVMTAAPPRGQRLENTMQILLDAGLIEQTWLHDLTYRDQPALVVLLGEYSRRQQAEAALAELPPELLESRPFTRRIGVLIGDSE